MKSFGKVDYVNGTLRITAYANFFGGNATSLLVVDPTGRPIRIDDKTQTYNLEMGHSRMVRSRHLVSYGGNFRHSGFNVSLAPDGKSRNEGGAYFQDEVRLSEMFRGVVGARIDRFDFLPGVILSPRTTLLVKPVPGQTLRLSYNRAYMAPPMLANYEQLAIMGRLDLGLIQSQFAGNYFEFPVHIVGNRDLQRQSLDAYELGYIANVAGGRTRLSGAAYINDSRGDINFGQSDSYTSSKPPPGWPLPASVLDALIAANAFGPGNGLPSVRSPRNLGKVRNRGIELSGDVRVNRYLSGYANYSWQACPQPRDFDISLLNLPPTHRFNASLGFDYGRYLGNVSVGYAASAYFNDVISVAYSGSTKA